MTKNSYFTPVPDRFIDIYMKAANGIQIKVYLCLLRAAASGKESSVEEIAGQTGASPDDVRSALAYWESRGLLPSVGAPESSSRAVPDKTQAGVRELTAFSSDQRRASLLSRIEQYVGKPLSVVQMQTVYYISEDLQFSDDLVDYLVSYCADQGKTDFRYIEKTAVNWAERGISNVRQAQQSVSSAYGQGRSGESTQANKFNHFQQNKYDFDQLERDLLEAEMNPEQEQTIVTDTRTVRPHHVTLHREPVPAPPAAAGKARAGAFRDSGIPGSGGGNARCGSTRPAGKACSRT